MLSGFALICFQVAAYDESLEIHTGHLTGISPCNGHGSVEASD